MQPPDAPVRRVAPPLDPTVVFEPVDMPAERNILDLENLGERELVRILTEPKNALVKQYQELFRYEGVQLEFEPAALTTIAREAVERGTGARGLRSVLEELLKEPMFNLPSENEVARCWVSEAAARGEASVGRDRFAFDDRVASDELSDEDDPREDRASMRLR